MTTIKTYKGVTYRSMMGTNPSAKSDGVLFPAVGDISLQADIFTNPTYHITGATDTMVTGTTTASTYVYTTSSITGSTQTDLSLGFIFTGGTDTLTATTTTFNYNIYGFNPINKTFGYRVFDATLAFPMRSFNLTGTTLNDLVNFSFLPSDNEYIVKPSFPYSFLNLKEPPLTYY